MKFIIGISLLVLGVVAFIGAFVFSAFANDKIINTQSQWPTVQGNISSTSNFYEDDDGYIWITVGFEDSVDGNSYSGKQKITVYNQGILYSQEDMDNSRLKYTIGETIPIYYNPQSPIKAMVNTAQVDEIPCMYYLLYLGGPTLFILGLFTIVYCKK